MTGLEAEHVTAALASNARQEAEQVQFTFEPERLTWRETRSRIRADRQRLLSLWAARGHVSQGGAWSHPSFICVALYRLSNHLVHRGHHLLARLAWQVNVWLTGADISQYSEIGAGFVVLSPAGTAVMGRAGRNFTLMPCAGIGGEVGREEDIGAGPGLPILGDDVVMEPHTGVLGPVRVGNRVRIAAGSVVTRNVPDDGVVTLPSPRFLHRSEVK
jgi:serine O-acetyltransferase